MKKSICILLTVLLSTVLFSHIFTANAQKADTNEWKTTEQAIQEYEHNTGISVSTRRYYFQMPDGEHGMRGSDGTTVAGTWYNDYSEGAGVYWWCGPASVGQKWPGYRAMVADKDQHIYYVDMPVEVVCFIWNNGVDSGKDESQPYFKCAAQTVDIAADYPDPGEYESIPEGADSFDGCIFIVDPDKISISDKSEMPTCGGTWYFYYGDGCYGSYATNSAKFKSIEENCVNPDHYINGNISGNHIANHIEPTGPTSTEPTPTEPTSTEPTPTEPIPTVPAPTEPICELHYQENEDGTLLVCGFENNTGLVDLVIPSEYNGKTVTMIGGLVFKKNSDIVSVTIPETISYIGYNAFGYCSNLETINYNCTRANLYHWSDYYDSKNVFDGCNAIKEINIGNNVESIPDYAFAGIDIDNISIFIIPENIKSIGEHIFDDDVTINTMKYYASDCQSIGTPGSHDPEHGDEDYVRAFPIINTLIVGKTVNTIPAYNNYCTPFSDTNLSKVIFENGIKRISGFCGCNQITEIIIPGGTEEISEEAFWNCSKLETIIIPKSVNIIGTNAFYNTSWLNNQPSGAVYINNVLYCYKDTSNDEDVVVRDGTTDIIEGAFSNATHIRSIIIPGSVQSVNKNAFYNCTSLKSVTLAKGITEIGDQAFCNCTSLETINFPDGIKTIGEFAFSNCGAITEIHIPDSAQSIGKSVFSNCSSLNNITFGVGITEISDYALLHCTSLETVIIPKNINAIGNNAFSGCTSLNTVRIPDGIQTIGDFAFSGCTSMKSAHIGKGVTVIPAGLFVSCTMLETVMIPDGVEEIKSSYKSASMFADNEDIGAFQDCSSLKSFFFPDTVQKIGGNTFLNCTSLEMIRLNSSIDVIGTKAFYNTALTNITIKNPNATLGFKSFGVEKTVYGDAPVYGFIVHGHKGSTAEKYAKDYKLTFAELNDEEYLGDVDGDGNVSILDATYIQRYLASLPNPFFEATRADVDGDDSITILDATHIQRWLASLPCPHGIGKPLS